MTVQMHYNNEILVIPHYIHIKTYKVPGCIKLMPFYNTITYNNFDKSMIAYSNYISLANTMDNISYNQTITNEYKSNLTRYKV